MSDSPRRGGKVCPVVHVQMRDVVPLSLFLHSSLPALISLNSITSFSVPLALPHILSFLHPYPPFLSHFSRFCLLTFHLSAQQIPLQLPKLCQKTLFLFIYFFCSFYCCQQFQMATLLERNILVKTLAEPRQQRLRRLTDAFIRRQAGKKQLGDSDWTKIGDCLSCTT